MPEFRDASDIWLQTIVLRHHRGVALADCSALAGAWRGPVGANTWVVGPVL